MLMCFRHWRSTNSILICWFRLNQFVIKPEQHQYDVLLYWFGSMHDVFGLQLFINLTYFTLWIYRYTCLWRIQMNVMHTVVVCPNYHNSFPALTAILHTQPHSVYLLCQAFQLAYSRHGHDVFPGHCGRRVFWAEKIARVEGCSVCSFCRLLSLHGIGQMKSGAKAIRTSRFIFVSYYWEFLI